MVDHIPPAGGGLAHGCWYLNQLGNIGRGIRTVCVMGKHGRGRETKKPGLALFNTAKS